MMRQGPLNIWTEHSNCQIHSRGDSKTLIALLIPNIFLIFFMKLFFYAYKSWGHDPIWYFSCLCRKFSELRALLFLSSTQTSQNLKFIQKCPCLSSLKNKFQWTQKKCLTMTHSKFIRPVSSYATLSGGGPIRTALRHAIHLAYTARRFKCTN